MHVSRISVVGMGKLGACMAACIASKGFPVTGVDISPKVLEDFREGRAPVLEPGLEDLMTANRARLAATADYKKAIVESDVTFLVVPTPSEDHGGFSLRYVAQAARDVGRALARKPGYHLIVLTSTVLPGSTQFRILDILEQESGKICGRDFGLCYNPEFIALGSVIHDFLNPDFVLIGESDEVAGQQLAEWYTKILDNNPPVVRMNFMNAELTKLAINTYVTTKITFANMLAEICEQLPGADIDTVSAALGMDSRIGRRYLSGALGYGGPCFPRDNLALSYLACQLGCDPLLAESTDKLNRSSTARFARQIQSKLHPGATVAVLGLAYKPNTDVVDESQGIAIAKELAEQGISVIVFDPVAMNNARRLLDNNVKYGESIEQCLNAADAVVIALPSSEFQALDVGDFPDRDRPVMVFDCWRILRERLSGNRRIEYIPLGVAGEEPALISRLRNLGKEALVS